MDAPATSYDRVPYPSLPFAQTHPARLAAVATLLGLTPAPVTNCRVLELGCAAGGNLLPMAAVLPGSQFVGVDLSARQIAEGQAAVRAAGLTNVDLRHADIGHINPTDGTFDYIICHGVYSWVPSAVQDQIFTACRERLSPQGIVYISYNTLPGWRLRQTVRDLLCFQARRFDGPAAQTRQARAMLDLLAEHPAREDGPHAAVLKAELDHLGTQPDHYLLHEFLEEHNEPLYFHEFARRAAGHKLRYLSEAGPGLLLAPAGLPPKTQAALRRLTADQLELEQFADFMRDRRFRQTLLCHAAVPVGYRPDPARLKGMYLSATARPVSATPDVRSEAPEQFRAAGGASVTATDPVTKAALVELAGCSPRPLPFAELLDRAAARANRPAGPAADPLAAGLLHCYVSFGLVDLSPTPPAFAPEVAARPAASRLARWQAEAGGQVANLRHEVVPLKPPERHALRHLDGTRDRTELTNALVGLVDQGVLKPGAGVSVPLDPAGLRAGVGSFLDQTLSRFANNALLLPARGQEGQ